VHKELMELGQRNCRQEWRSYWNSLRQYQGFRLWRMDTCCTNQCTKGS